MGSPRLQNWEVPALSEGVDWGGSTENNFFPRGEVTRHGLGFRSARFLFHREAVPERAKEGTVLWRKGTTIQFSSLPEDQGPVLREGSFLSGQSETSRSVPQKNKHRVN